MRDFDVAVVGGGPAGSTSALKCSQSGLSTVLLEKGMTDRHKPCGGVLPYVCIDILDDLGLRIPSKVMCSPPTIGLYYVPPSGRSNGGSVRNYKLLNVNRDRFDEWLRKAAEVSGATTLHEAKFVRFESNGDIKVIIQVGAQTVRFSTRYLIGADGAFSTVRRQLYPSAKVDYLSILQERCTAKGDFGEYFYAFFRGDVTPTYSYAIPKNGALVVGTAVPHGHHMAASDSISRFKKWLQKEFGFNPAQLERREWAAIPYGLPICGDGNIILVGDAAGFCNHLSGEGVRLAIESGIAASEAVVEAQSDRGVLSSSYMPRVTSLTEFVQRTHEFAIGMTDDARERFVKSELARASLDSLKERDVLFKIANP